MKAIKGSTHVEIHLHELTRRIVLVMLHWKARFSLRPGEGSVVLTGAMLLVNRPGGA